MSVSGLCQVCEQRQSEHSCPRCGRVVCEVHYDEEVAYCTVCAAELRQARGEGGAGEGGPGDDVPGGGEVDPDDVHR